MDCYVLGFHEIEGRARVILDMAEADLEPGLVQLGDRVYADGIGSNKRLIAPVEGQGRSASPAHPRKMNCYWSKVNPIIHHLHCQFHLDMDSGSSLLPYSFCGLHIALVSLARVRTRRYG